MARNPTHRLVEMLEFRRPAGSVYEQAFINKYIKPYNPTEDAYGNFIIDVGDNPEIIWSSHTDTVHKTSGLQRLKIDKKNVITVVSHKESNCLGADCTTGVWIMLEMLDAGISGRYIFHRAEEIGGLGSKWIAANTPKVLDNIKAAIAFDRKGTSDIITHQGVSRTASDEFAVSLGLILGGSFKPSANGSFTDTKSYMGLVPECTNISVGYSGAHSFHESQDLIHARWLRDQMIKFDATNLVIKRKPAEPQSYAYTGGNGYYHNGGGHYTRWKDPETIFELVREYPSTIAKVLELVGFDFLSLSAACDEIRATADYSIPGSPTGGTANLKVVADNTIDPKLPMLQSSVG